MMKVLRNVVCALLLSSPALGARHDPPPGDTPRIDRGVLTDLDLSSRTGMVNGFSYEFGSILNPVEVKLYNSNAGALELLYNGMKVEVFYLDTGDSRIAISVEQLSADEIVEF